MKQTNTNNSVNTRTDLNARFQKMLGVAPETKNTGKYNGFDNIDDHEFVLDRLLTSLRCDYGDLNEFVDTIMVRQEDGRIHIYLNEDEATLNSLDEIRKLAKRAFKDITDGNYEDNIISLGFSCVEGVTDGRINLSYEGDTWSIPCTEEAVFSELVEEAMVITVEGFVKDNEAEIKEFFLDEE